MSERPHSRRRRRDKRGPPAALQNAAESILPILSSGPIKLDCEFLEEPHLVFSDRRLCEDPRTGLTAFGPYSKTDVTRRTAIRIGIVGAADAVDRALSLLKQMSAPIPQAEKVDAMLHPSFPGINEGEPFQVEMLTQTVWQRALRPADIASVENHPDFTVRVKLLLDAVTREVRALQQLDTCPDVVLVVMTERLEKLCRVGIGEHDAQASLGDDEDELDDVTEGDLEGESGPVPAEQPAQPTTNKIEGIRSFRRGLKAGCLGLLPTQLLWHRTLAGSRGVQDLPTRAWNLSIALLYKAGIVPWRLAEVMDGSCFVGISFFHPDGVDKSSIRSSVAQAFTDRGEGFVLQGARFEWDSQEERDKSPHLSRDAARDLLVRVLQTYREQIQVSPRRVVVHKSSRFTEDERLGFEDALAGTAQYGLITIARRGTCCLRPGNKPVLRGSIIHFGEKKGLIFTIGYIPFLRCYPGFRIPQPLEVTENWGSVSFREAARDILRLTKLNWNSAAFSCVDPITLAFSKRVGEILRVANVDNPALHYRYYM
jgi:hypothetical protein